MKNNKSGDYSASHRAKQAQVPQTTTPTKKEVAQQNRYQTFKPQTDKAIADLAAAIARENNAQQRNAM